jgi:LytS/YehU family sensor histidine kinase
VSVLRIALAGLAASIALLILNAVLFPVIFPHGLAEQFTNARDHEPVAFHLLAFVATGLLIASVAAFLRVSTLMGGVILGALLGLLVSLPEHLHLYAMTTATAMRQFIPVPWTVATWSVATGLAAIVPGWLPLAKSAK